MEGLAVRAPAAEPGVTWRTLYRALAILDRLLIHEDDEGRPPRP